MAESIDKKAIKKRILFEIEKLTESVISLKEQAKPISPENAIGRISRMDAINNKSVIDAALSKSKIKLLNLEAALNNIENPNFGSCTRCGNSIQIGRLMYMPESTRCIHCAGK